MNLVEKKNIIDKHKNWDIVVYNNTRFSFQTCDELMMFLKNEMEYWKKYEEYFRNNDFSFSQWYENCCRSVSEIFEIIQDKESLPDTFLEQVQTIFKQNKINIKFNPNGSVMTLTNSEVMYSTNIFPEAISYAYRIFYTSNKIAYKKFIEICYNNTLFSRYLNSSNNDEHEAAIRFLGFKITENEYELPNQQNKEKIIDISNAANNLTHVLLEKQKDINEFLDVYQKRLNTQYEDTKADFDNFIQTSNDWYNEAVKNVNSLEEIHRQKVALSEPVKHWETQAKKRLLSFWLWLSATIMICVGLISFVINLLSTMLYQIENIHNVVEVTPLYSITQYFIFVAIITFLVYIIRIFVKITMAEKHIYTEFSQKAAFTFFYLSLLKEENNAITKEERPIVISALFSKIDTGLIKNGAKSSETDAGLWATLKKQ